MTTAKARISRNAGAPVTGGVVGALGDVIQLSGLDVTGWTSQRWELYGFPPGWTAPVGWTLVGSTYVSTALAPPAFTASIWGKYMVRLTVNGGVRAGTYAADLIDETCALSVPSASGVEDLGVRESTQFSQRGWQDAVSKIARLLAASAVSDVRTASTIVVGGAATQVLEIDDLAPGVYQVDVYAVAANAGNTIGASYKRGLAVRAGVGAYAAIGTVTDGGTAEDAGASGWNATVQVTGASVLVMVTGAAQWSVTAQILSAINPNPAPPGPPPDLVSLLPTSGPTAGGTSVVLTGTDFTGATSVTFGGVAAASFTVDSSTQITAVTPALFAGAKDVVVTTPYGTDTLAAAFTASVFALGDLAWEVWLKGSSRSASQITGTASTGGGSGGASRKLTSTGGNAIAAGPTFNALPSVDWNSDDMWSFGNFVLSDIVAAGGNEFTCLMVLQVNSYTTTGSSFHDIPRIFGTGGGGAYFGIGAHNDGAGGKLVIGLYDSGFKTHKVAFPTATKQVVAMRLTAAGVLGIKIGAAAWVNLTSVGAIASLTNYLNSFSASAPSKADADMAEFLFAKVAHSDGNISAAQTALATTYGITL